MDGPRPRRGSDYFRDLLIGIETAAGECRAEGFRGWMWALRTLGVDPPSCRSSDIEGVSFLDDVRRKRERALLALEREDEPGMGCVDVVRIGGLGRQVPPPAPNPQG